MNASPCTNARRSPSACRTRAVAFAALALFGGGAGADIFLAPVTMSMLQGSASEQGVATLAERSLSGTADVWGDYVEFSTGAHGAIAEFDFELPLDALDASLDALSIQTNYKGPARRFQKWGWSIRNVATGRWTFLGDNRRVPDWRWQPQRLALTGAPEDHVDALGRVRIRLRSPVAGDDANLDYLSLRVATSASRPTAGREPAAAAASDAAAAAVAPVASSSGGASRASGGAAPGIWRPAPGTSWQIQYTGQIDTSLDVDMYNLDLYDTSAERIRSLQRAGRAVVCYFSAGTREQWRPDAGRFPNSVLGAPNADWPGERWLDIRNLDVLAPIMRARLDLAASKGCDGVDPDNVDAYTNATGLPLTADHQLAYNRFLANAAHARGLSIGLKNDVGQVAELEPYFDWAVNESCNRYDECDLLSPFVAAGKAVFGIEYTGDPTIFCSRTNALDFDFLKKPRLLGAAREACR